jgi:pilus assembly protein Flp/PilA
MERIKKFLADESGVTAIEYGLIAALVAVVIIATVTLVGEKLSSNFDYIQGKLTTPTN